MLLLGYRSSSGNQALVRSSVTTLEMSRVLPKAFGAFCGKETGWSGADRTISLETERLRFWNGHRKTEILERLQKDRGFWSSTETAMFWNEKSGAQIPSGACLANGAMRSLERPRNEPLEHSGD